MRIGLCAVLFGTFLVGLSTAANGQEARKEPVPEKLGAVNFSTSCSAAAQMRFGRSVALLHSFVYPRADAEFEQAVVEDPKCAIAYWGMAMSHFHELWDPPLPAGEFTIGQREIRRAEETRTASDRERGFIEALALIYDSEKPYTERALNYESAMKKLAAAYPDDTEAQVFYALALLAAASPFDKTHARQKQAIEILEPLFRRFPDHPGIPHYLIHACDSSELASRGVAAAQAYSAIAPSAPHALHMPSHIFTRLGMWDDSIRSNLAAKAAARDQGDVGEGLHAMDYLVYAYLQEARSRDAAKVIDELRLIERQHKLDESAFIASYAATAMPVRYAVEQRRWTEAAKIAVPTGAPPHVVAVAVWARALGLARSGHPAEAGREIEKLRSLEETLRNLGNANAEYWARQLGVQTMEASAWIAQAEGQGAEARNFLTKAADEEDSMEKLPVTPGPVIPAREQLGDLLLEQNEPGLAMEAYRADLASSPKRRNGLRGLARARRLAQERG